MNHQPEDPRGPHVRGGGDPLTPDAVVLGTSNVRAHPGCGAAVGHDDAGQAAIDCVAAGIDRHAATMLLQESRALREAAARDWERAALAHHRADLERTAAEVDELTGALRRGSGYAALRQKMEHCRTLGVAMLIGFVDVDDMKRVNDNLGHEAGDRLLAAVAGGLRDVVRPDDVVVRFGGDEFIFCLTGATLERTIDRFTELRSALGRHNGSTISGGFAQMQPDDTVEHLIARADDDLYSRRTSEAIATRTATEDEWRPDALETLMALTTRCVDLLDVQSAGVLLADGHGGLQLIAASGEQPRSLGLAQIEQDAGPWIEAYTTGLPVCHHDLGTAADLWPDFAPLAVRAGARWVHAEPVRSLTGVSGTLGLLRTTPGATPPVDLQMTRVVADIIGLHVAQDVAMRTLRVHAGRLRQALTSRGAIEQAKGMLAQHARIDIDDASRLLHEHARARSRRVSAVAEEIVAGAVPLADVVAVPQGHQPT